MKTLFVLALMICLAAAGKARWYGKYRCKYPGHFKDPYYCQAFIQCDAHGRAFRLWCPYGTVFNPYARVCDHKWKKLCKSGYYSSKKRIYKSKRCKYPGHFRNPWDCASFIQCDDHGKAHYLHCPYGTIFNQKIGVCVHYNRYTKYLCKHGYPHYIYGYKKNPCKYRGGLHPYPNDCNKFIQCVHGYPQLMPCPAGLVWDNYLKRCEWYRRKYYKRYRRCHYYGKYYGK